MRIVEACADPDSDLRRIAAIASADGTLTAALLRVANSAHYAFSVEVRTVAQAVTLLGQRAVRSLVLCFAVRDAFGRDRLHGFDATPYWEAALRRAVAARLLARQHGHDPDESFTLGLLLDVGLLASFCLAPRHIGSWHDLLALDPDARLVRERELFARTHAEVGAELARAWSLPGDFAEIIGGHHRVRRPLGAAAEDGLMLLAHDADWVAAVFSCEDRRAVVRHVRALLGEHWGMDERAADALLAQISVEVQSAAGAMSMPVPEQPRYETLLTEANLLLAEENIGYQELAWRLQAALDERDVLARRVRDEMDKARIVQRSLLPGHTATQPPDPALPCHGINAPARELSGDFYDYFLAEDGHCCFALADVSGKGMDAALLMAKTSSLFHCLGKRTADPARLLSLLNAELYELSVRGMFVSMVAGTLDRRTAKVRMVNAGHPPALYFSGGTELSVVPATSPPLGVVPACHYEAVELDLAGGRLYLFTDGLLEATDEHGRELGYAGLLALLRACEAIAPQERLAGLLATTGERYDLGRDDVTVLLVEP